jgi:LPXTG-motif cell wall-anchored protein
MVRTTIVALGAAGGAASAAAALDHSDGVEIDVHITPLDDVTPTPTAPEPTTDPAGLPTELPSTGVELSLLPYLAGAAVLVGGATLLASRRRT